MLHNILNDVGFLEEQEEDAREQRIALRRLPADHFD